MPLQNLCDKCKNDKCKCRACKGIHNACVPSFDDGWQNYAEGCFFNPDSDKCYVFKE